MLTLVNLSPAICAALVPTSRSHLPARSIGGRRQERKKKGNRVC